MTCRFGKIGRNLWYFFETYPVLDSHFSMGSWYTNFLGTEETQQEKSKSNTFVKSDGLNENEVHSEPLEVNLQALDNFSKIIEKVVKQIKYVPVIQARDRTDFSKKGM